MPVPLILSDLPPTIEQSDVSTNADDVEGVQAASFPWQSGNPSTSLLGDEVSRLSSISGQAREKTPDKRLNTVLPAWLVGETVGVGSAGVAYSLPLPGPVAAVAGVAQDSAPVRVDELSQLPPIVSERPTVEGLPEPLIPGDQAKPLIPEDQVQLLPPPLMPGDEAEAVPPTQHSGEDADLILRADQQFYNPLQQTVRASGDVLVQFGDAQLAAERLWVNLNNRYLRAEGDVFFNRNEQILEGDTATYNLLQGSGEITNGRGDLLLSTLGEDLATLPFAVEFLDNAPIDYRLQREGTISSATSPGGVTIGTESRPVFGGEGGNFRRLRFESETIYFDADGWYAEELRITNDPFSPPELELRGNSVRLTLLNEEEAELYIENPRLVFDQGLTLPLLKERYILQRGQLAPNELNPLPTGIGVDGRDRDGLFVEREFSFVARGPWQVSVVPQFYLGRWLGESGNDLFDPANFGVVARAHGRFGPRTQATATASLPGLDLENFADRLRARIQAQQLIGDHVLSLEYTYRDRLYNGSLGFQNVQNSLGLLLQSPLITLGDTRINLSYQVSGQYVTANTDDPDLLAPGEGVGQASLLRFQGAVDLSRNFTLWQGTPLPATPTEGLRYSPRPIVPYLALGTGLQGVTTYYSNDTLQETVKARVSLLGQLGHLRRNYLDYTQFNIQYSTSFITGEDSPFFFDRAVDNKVLSGGIIQQIYGPLLAGFQTSINLNTGEEIDTDFILEYRRRAYGVLLQYSPTRETGFLGFRISDFNWSGRTLPFDADSAATSPGNDGVMVD